MLVIKELLIYAIFPGAGGGLAWFFCGLKNGWIRNNKFARKALLEIVGGLLVATFVIYPARILFAGPTPVVLLSFAAGAGWSGIMQTLRRWITKYVIKFLSAGNK